MDGENNDDDDDAFGEDHNDNDNDDENNVMELAEVIYNKTRGNVYFTIQVIEELIRKNVIYFSRMTFNWEWNLDGIDLEQGLSDTLVGALISKIETLSKSNGLLQSVLKVAAYTNRSTIHIDILQKLLGMDGTLLHIDELCTVMDQAVVQGLFQNSMGSQEYSFAHDRIQQAALQLVPEGRQRDQYKYSMGHRLLKLARVGHHLHSSDPANNNNSNGGKKGHQDASVSNGSDGTGRLHDANKKTRNDSSWLWYAAVDHFNATQHTMNHDPFFITRLNLQVGEKASYLGAYETASTYLQNSMMNLMKLNDPWKNHYGLTLRLYRTIAQVEFCQGHFEIGNGIANKVLAHGREFEDKLPTYLSLTSALGREEAHEDALQLNRKVLIQLGSYPQRFLVPRVARDLAFVKRYFSKHSHDQILQLPRMTNKTHEQEMGLLNELSTQAVYCDDMIHFLVAMLRMVRLTIKHGHSSFSAIAFAKYSMFLGNVNSQKMAIEIGKLTERTLAERPCKTTEAISIFGVTHWVDAWNTTHEQTLNSYKRAHKIGMRVGDIDSAFVNSFGAIHHAHGCGYPLIPLEIATVDLLEQMQLYQVKSTASMLEQVLFTITGLATPLPNDDETIDWDALASFSARHDGHSEKYRLLFGFLGRCEIGLYMGNYKFAHQMAIKMWEVLPRDTAYIVATMRVFYAGMAASGLARTTRKRRYLKIARRWYRRLSKLNRAKDTKNNHHRELIMAADLQSAMRAKESTVKMYFEKAITASFESGHVHDEALANELLGEYYLDMFRNPNLHGHASGRDATVTSFAAKYYLSEARRLYWEWGAKAKVQQMDQTRRSYLDTTSYCGTSVAGSSNGGGPNDHASKVIPNNGTTAMSSNGSAGGGGMTRNRNSYNNLHHQSNGDALSASGRNSLDMEDVFSSITPSHKMTSEAAKARRQSTMSRVSVQLTAMPTSVSGGGGRDSSRKGIDEMSVLTDPSIAAHSQNNRSRGAYSSG